MNVLLISVQADFDVIGLKHVHYYLLNHGHDSLILFLPNFRLGDKKALRVIRRFVDKINPKMIGIGMMSEQFLKARNITEYLKKNGVDVPFVWGGIHATIAPEMCAEHADYVCVGEGEKATLDLVNAIEKGKSVKDVKNICYKEGGKIKKNGLYPLIEDLDEVSSYDYVPKNGFVQREDGVIVKLNKKIYRRYARYNGTFFDIMISRGCPFACSYCCNNFLQRTYSGAKKVRRRSTENILNEIEKAIKENPQIMYVNIHDDCFLAGSNEYIKDFCEAYKKRIGKLFIIRTIPNYINREKMAILKEAGLAWVNVGLQSGSDRVCKEVYNRPARKADFLKAANIIKEFNVSAFYDILVDNPFETEEDQFETVYTLMQTPKPFAPQLYSLTFYFGTDIFERVKKEFPEKMEDEGENPLKKDFLIYHQSDMNTMIRLACFLNRDYMKWLIKLYKKNKKGFWFKSNLFIAKTINTLILEPLTYIRMLSMAERGFFKALKVLPMYIKVNARRYLGQFRGSKA